MNRSLSLCVFAFTLAGCCSHHPFSPPMPAPGTATGTVPPAVHDATATPAEQAHAADVIEKANHRD